MKAHGYFEGFRMGKATIETVTVLLLAVARTRVLG
jgi:hypothetical protein